MAIDPIQLDKDQLKAINELDTTIQHLHMELNRAEEAGLDVADLRQRLKDADELRKGIRRVYGTPRRRTVG